MAVKQVKILVVDDDLNFLKTIKSAIESQGHYVKTVNNEKDAIATLLMEPFHIALIDCILKQGQGVGLANKIQKYLGNSLDIILVSGIFPRSSVSGFINKGISDFLRKPISNAELAKKINKAKNNILFDEKNDFLLKIFDKNIAIETKLKDLIFKKESSSPEFLLILSLLLSFKTKSLIKISKGNQTYEIIMKQGKIINCRSSDEIQVLLKHLIKTGLLSEEESQKFKNISPQEILDMLVQNCHISPYDASQFQEMMLHEALKTISSNDRVSFHIDLFYKGNIESNYLEFSQNDLANFLLEQSSPEFSSHVENIFNEENKTATIKFLAGDKKYHEKLMPIVEELKNGAKIQKFFTNDESSAALQLFAILCLGDVTLSNEEGQVNYYYLSERYKNLKSFLDAENTEKVFQLLSNTTESADSHKLVKNIYRNFMKFNHVDRFDQKLPKEIVNSINSVASKMKYHHDIVVDVEFNMKVEQKKKEQVIREEMKIAEKEQICMTFLENEKFDQALDVIKTIQPKIIEENMSWQIFYLWISFAAPQLTNNQKETKSVYEKS